MKVRQADIAKACELDVSSVNKILNRTPGPIFSQDTIRKVFQTAKEMGWKPSPNAKSIERRKRELAEAENATLKAENKSLKDQLAAILKYKSA